MRTLMLHGHGTSAQIFEAQTTAFRSKLDETFTFDFVNAPNTCPPSPGLEQVFKAKSCYTWYRDNSAKSVRIAHQWLDNYFEDHGRFDAVCCFSQGCSLIASYLFYHSVETPHRQLPFRSAMFICGGVNYDILEDLGLAVSHKSREISRITGQILKDKAGDLAYYATNIGQIRRGHGLWDDTGRLFHDPGTLPDRFDCFGLDYTSLHNNIFIKVPTVHIYGAKDPRWPASQQLACFCDNRRVYDHGGGHEIPRSGAVSDAIAGLFAELARTTELPGSWVRPDWDAALWWEKGSVAWVRRRPQARCTKGCNRHIQEPFR